jgi:hypothetical protein
MVEKSSLLGVCAVFNYYVHIIRGDFPNVSCVCSIFFFDAVNDGSKLLCMLYCVLYRGVTVGLFITN